MNVNPNDLVFLADRDDDDKNHGKVKQMRPDPMADGFGPYMTRSIHSVFFTTKLNYLLICVRRHVGARWRVGRRWVFTVPRHLPVAERLDSSRNNSRAPTHRGWFAQRLW